jgi:hypothetical protein
LQEAHVKLAPADFADKDGILFSDWRNIVCVTMVIVLPASLQSQNPDAAMLHASGAVQINRSPAPPSAAIFPDNLLETGRDGGAKIDAAGSTAVMASDTLLQFEGNELFLEHGTVQVTTSTQMTVRVGCITAIPVNASWTQYEVTDVNGKITVNARKSDVNIDRRKSQSELKREGERSDRVSVREGQQTTREEKCGAAIRPPDYVAGKDGLFDTWQARATGLILVGAITCFGICHGDDPVSPSTMSGK